MCGTGRREQSKQLTAKHRNNLRLFGLSALVPSGF